MTNVIFAVRVAYRVVDEEPNPTPSAMIFIRFKNDTEVMTVLTTVEFWTESGPFYLCKATLPSRFREYLVRQTPLFS